jgi:uncharacterized 2Fe-2S/4Fe-4S cluster protein (DUF4445 family)
MEDRDLVIHAEHGSPLNGALEQAGVYLEGPCGGRGACGLCEVMISGGDVNPPTRAELRQLSEDKRLQGYRLACQTRVLGDIHVTVAQAESGTQRILTTGTSDFRSVSPPVRAYDLVLEPPSLSDPKGDDRRLLDELLRNHGIDCGSMDVTCLREASVLLRKQDWSVRALVRGRELIALTESVSQVLGVAVDLGTTGIAAYLCDLEDGEILGTSGILNPQHTRGEDIIARIEAARKSSDNAGRLQEMVLDAINSLTSELAGEVGHKARDIAETVIVANTAMHHLLLGLPLDQLARAPHVPAVSTDVEVKARDIGLDAAQGAYAYLPSNPAAFVGSDHVAVLIACGAEQSSGPALFIDIGTNTEICLVVDETMTSVSCASGPAFEGGNLSCGMRAGSGAIERLTLTDEHVDFRTIDARPPRGLCGSGVVDLLAEMTRVGAVDPSGRLLEEHARVLEVEGRLSFDVLAAGQAEAIGPIVFTQQDVRNLQLAKAAIAAGTQVLLGSRGLNADDLTRVVVAGAFGNYINVNSAQMIGLLPPVSAELVEQVGNAAGMGAAMMLVSESVRKQARKLSGRLTYLELAAQVGFKAEFMKAIPIPHTWGEENS